MELDDHYAEIQGLDAEVLAISSDDLSGANWVVEQLGLPFPILYNPGVRVIRDYGVYSLLGDGLATPSTFIVDKDGVIRWKYVGNSIYERPSVYDVLEQLRLLGG